ncbi:MAG: proton-conducting membrane transporter, partial [Lachnospiraceae bacterium]|nr:proton-conducting membrane transporter [Lachnospiraceae bacterium]
GLSRVFCALISWLWPLATLYATEYMEHEASEKTLKEKTFFGMYVITFGVTMGIAFAENMLAMYVFYEMLTLVTIPLILFTMSDAAIAATRKYIVYSLGGAAFAFISLIFLMAYGDEFVFKLGGVIHGTPDGRDEVLRLIYVFAFFGFGVKAAVWPVNSWLPQAGVAPTPVTALLHAVAVVKSGAFAIIRLTYYSFGTDFLRGSWAQHLTMGFAIFTIVYGCSMAVKERHIKRRLAYSTISNLSYILFGATLMTPLGMVGAMTHMVFHGVMKISSFLCAGAVICKAHKNYVYELEGMAKRMPKTFFIFTISAFALMGVPGICGFFSKWQLASAGISSGTIMGYVGVGAILVSALLTAIYMMQMVLRAYFPVEETTGEKCDLSWQMLVPLVIFVTACVLMGVFNAPIIAFFEKVAGGLI